MLMSLLAAAAKCLAFPKERKKEILIAALDLYDVAFFVSKGIVYF